MRLSKPANRTHFQRKSRLFVELLEDRTLLSNGQWLAVFEGVPTEVGFAEQTQYGQNLLHSVAVADENVSVVRALDLSGTFLLQTPLDVSQETVTDQLDEVSGFVFVQAYDAPAPEIARQLTPARIRSEAIFGPFDYDNIVEQELHGLVPDQSGPVDPVPADSLTNNNTGSNGSAFYTQSETTLVAFGNTVVVGFNDSGSNATASNKFTGFARSTDGGATFTDGGVLPTNPGGDAGDPVMVRNDATGRIYFSTLGFSDGLIKMFRSDDNGVTWAAPTNATPGGASEDKQWHIVDNFAGSGNGNVYLLSRRFGGAPGIYFFRSTDQGNTFGPTGGTLITSGAQGAYITVAPDHSIYAFWYAGTTLQVRKSTNQGLTFGAAVTVVSGLTGGSNGDLALVGQNNGEAFTRTIRSNSFPHVAVNPLNGHLYATFNDNPVGTDKGDVYMVMSTDGGVSWSVRVKINDDVTTNDQWQPTIAITPDGSKLGIFYYSRQEDMTTADGDPINNQFKYYGRIGSISGSTVTFAPSFAVSDTPSKPEVGRDSLINTTYMGDYDTAVATPGAFHVTWSDSRALLPGGGTRMDPNVFYEKISLGLTVASTVPAVGSVVSSAPVDYVVNFSDPIDTLTVQASDFTVTDNLGTPVAADSFLATPTQVTFHYNVAPFSNQGSHTMAMAAGSVLRFSDASPLVAFSGAFNFDSLGLAVTTTVPPAGGVFTLPAPFSYVVNFNEDIAAASVSIDDLTLSAGTVTGAVASGPSQATYTLSGIVSELTLSITVGAGKLTDTFGNPNPAAFVASYAVDIGTVPYPVPLLAKAPLGSLVYDPTASGIISPAGDTDSFTLNIDPGQTITIVVRPTVATLQPTVTLQDPANVVLATAVAPLVNQNAIIQTVSMTTGGVYTITVGGVGGTTGSYTVQVILNASEELERNVGQPTNNTAPTAQNIDPSFISLGGAATRGAVMGTVASSVDLDFYGFTLAAGDTATVALKGISTTNVNVQLRDSGGVTVLANGVLGPTNLDRVLTDFTAAVGGTFYLVVSSTTAGATYDLVVARNAEFKSESNNTTALAQNVLSQQVAGEQWALGHVTSVDPDIYRVNLGAGATLTAQTFTPAGGAGEFVNNLNPRLRVLNSVGTQVAIDDNSAGDGRNALVTFVNSGAAGVFFVEVSITPTPVTSGEYIVRIAGNTVTLPPFLVTSTTPANGAVVLTPPTTITVNFNDAYLATSVQASDLQVDGLNATAVTQVDGDTLNFTVPAGVSGPGTHTVTIAVDAILDVQGTSLTAYTGTYFIDNVAPRVTATSLAPNAVVAPGSLSYQVTFSEPMKVLNLTSDDFSLHGNFRQAVGVNYAASSFSYNPAGTVVTLNYTGLPDDNYTLTLIAGVAGGTNFTDAAGNTLDGEFTGTFPSGNGVAGGNFVIGFNMDLATEAYPAPLAAKLPLGSMIYDPSLTRVIAFAGDTDSFTLNVDPGQTISVLVTPTTAALRPTVELRDPANVLVATATAAVAGQPVVLNPVSATVAGTYTVTVSGAGGTTGLYTAQVTLNAALELEGNGGAANDTRATAQAIDTSFITLQTPQASAQRGAVLGGNASAASVPVTTYDFESGQQGWTINNNIIGTGTLAGLWHLSTRRGADANHSPVISFYYGSETTGNFNTGSRNAGVIVSPSFVVPTGGGINFKYFLATEGTGSFDQAILQISNNGGATWTNLLGPLAQASTFTSASASLATFVGQTVQIRFSFDTIDSVANAFEGWYVDDVQLTAPGAWNDYYSFTAASGETSTIALKHLSGSGATLSLENAAGTVLASGVAGSANLDQVISNFHVPASDTYFVRVNGVAAATYSVVATKNAAFDTEANDAFATAQNISGVQGVLGHVTGGAAGSLFDLTGPTVTGPIILSGTKITLGFNADGSFITAGGGTGIRYNGVEFVVPGSPVASFTVGYNGLTFTNNAANGVSQITGITMQNLSSGTLNGLRIVGTASATVRVERVVVFNQSADFVTVATRLTNLSGVALTNVATLENIDPDQDSGTTFTTLNDVVLGGQFVRASGPSSNLTVGLGSADSRSVVSAEGFDNRLPFEIINTPVDPNGANADIAIAQAFNFGGLGVSAQVSGIAIMAFGTTAAAADTVFSNNSSGLSVGDEDWYSINVTSTANALRLETSTPADGPSEFVNTLNPKIELYDPSNVLVASGTVTGDGRNEFIQHTPLVTGIYRVRVLGEGATKGEFFLTKNFSPLVSASVTSPINENDTATLTGTISDPDGMDTHTVVITWGPDEGSTTLNLAAGVSTFSATHQYLDDNSTATASDDYPIGITVTDNHGATGSASTSVTVNNLDPVIDSLSATSVNENGTVHLTGTYHDVGTQDTHKLTIDWGEGAPETVDVSGGSFVITHQYLDDNPTDSASDDYTIAVILTDDDTGVDTDSTTTTITNVDPVIDSLSATSVFENGTVHLTGTYHDVGTQDTHKLTIDWGEGAPETVDVSGGSFDITHQYLDDNPTETASDDYTIAVILTDDDTGADTGSTTTTITNVAPILTSIDNSSPDCGMAGEGEAVTVSGTFTDVGTQDTHSATINWGDGNTTDASISEAGGSGSLTGTHAYAAGGIYTVTVTFMDDDGATISTTTTTVIVGVGVVGDTLYVIGTHNADFVTVNQDGSVYQVYADFLTTGTFRDVPTAGVNRIVVQACDGDDQVAISSGITLPAILDGGNGADHINGGNGPNIILGGDGDDMLIGGSGRDFLIGGRGADHLVGNGGDDIFIAGYTSYDTDYAALNAILAVWYSGASYASRVAAIQGALITDGPGQNVFSDSAVDQITGSAGSDLFFANTFADSGDDLVSDIITNVSSGETVLDIDAA